MIKIPPQYVWPSLIIAFLAFNIGWSMTILFAARSDGGVQIVPDYYQKSVNFNEELEARNRARARGWVLNASLEVDRGILRLSTAASEPVEGVEGVVAFTRPFLTVPMATVSLKETTSPGVYEFENRADAHGLWDLEFLLRQDDTPTPHSIRLNLSQ